MPLYGEVDLIYDRIQIENAFMCDQAASSKCVDKPDVGNVVAHQLGDVSYVCLHCDRKGPSPLTEKPSCIWMMALVGTLRAKYMN